VGKETLRKSMRREVSASDSDEQRKHLSSDTTPARAVSERDGREARHQAERISVSGEGKEYVLSFGVCRTARLVAATTR